MLQKDTKNLLHQNFCNILKKIKKLFSLDIPVYSSPIYSFCESGISGRPWHIRILTGQEQKLGGGIDTASLCQKIKPLEQWGFGGWDLKCKIDKKSLSQNNVCKQCKEIYYNRVGSDNIE